MIFKVGIHTLGCRVNQYESSAIAERLGAMGISVVNSDRNCDFYIVNTCAVTAESERKSRQTVRRMAAHGKVAVIGCASQLNNVFAEIPNVVYVGGCGDKYAVTEAVLDESMRTLNNVGTMDGAEYEKMSISGMDKLFSECRAYIKIQDGCNGKCSYCIIPKCRGRVRSRPYDEIIDEAKRLSANGYREIILTGIETGAYNKAPLADVIRGVSEIEGLARVRLGSLSPNVINKSFLSAAAESENFMPHIHLSLQSCCDRILRLMNRPYTKKDIYERVSLIREYIPNAMISADIIVGFPTESDDEYKETEIAVSELSLFHVHSFPFSERKGTPAAEMEGKIPVSVRTERNSALIRESARVKAALLDGMKGQARTLLVEKIRGGFAYGHSEDFLEMKLPDNGFSVGDMIKTVIVSNDGGLLLAAADTRNT